MSKIRTPENMVRIREDLKKDGQTVVFANGCFDILHLGHIRLFQEGKRQGSVLVVAVNTDDTVRRQKGPSRPIFPLSERLEVLDALESVDHLVPFSEDTPLELILLLKPDVLIKGGDWKQDEVVGKKEVEGWGGRVIHFPYVSGSSTTTLVEKIIRSG
ncbi:MAG: D-glycero-beta-D-manno-heptose 1-phosphate adenylyltransferase [Acidobacteria bacterium]|nr:D-glycero-beta-D-manno-heptose 1-phosphate adenylyltransferase [Acidobacteriota bacterium]MCG2814321.1 D-glycero-beta-D-manno-heptose 1-phosphate adenylyltransferase [Candidatus Aminicenantes bacterium]MBU1339080.1 D-glycero-beta-D-manno-heptose 1-phosphate adenylyltransferase [Acidobacteriota bacterium]MBU1473546.1 D-glycero-beta-D-manno-heptose 1-phosphate adenylyltransferase [Acidobacteriota bacterium]MBU2439092.1 D-glycero-beta-D-manno-heptose 1-phosphate adenylyltransferase [Acidobacter